MAKPTFWLPLSLSLIGACGGQVTLDPTDGGRESEEEGAESDVGTPPEGDAGTPQEGGVGVLPESGADALWANPRTCPKHACVPSDSYFPKVPLLRSSDLGPDVTFLKVSRTQALAVRDNGDVLTANVPLSPSEPPIVHTLPSASLLRPKDIASSAYLFGVLACDQGCRVFVPSKQDGGMLVAHVAGEVPLPGEPDVLLAHDIPEEESFFCVLGDGAACIRNDKWEVWVHPGTGPRVRDMAVGGERTVLVGDGGRWVTFEGNFKAGSPVEGWLEPARNATLVTPRYWNAFLAVGHDPSPTIWNIETYHEWSCELPSLPKVLAIKEFNGELHGVHAGGYPFKETLVEETWTWVDACPPEGAPFHGELIDADVLVCGIGLNYIGLQPKVVLGTVNCPMGH